MDIFSIQSRPIVGHPSFATAISAAKVHPLQEKARSDAKLLAGQTFLGGQCNYTRWSLEFTGSLWVDITCDDGKPNWKVVHDAPVFSSCLKPFAVKWASGHQSIIDPNQLISERIGAEFWQFWVNEVGFFVYLRRKLILWFHVAQRLDDGSDILYVSEDD